jgi:hypothetical protein
MESIFPLIEHQMKTLFNDTHNFKAIFSALANVVHGKYMRETPHHNVDAMLLLENIIKRTNIKDLDVMTTDAFDPVHVFYELKAYCILELSAKIQEMTNFK